MHVSRNGFTKAIIIVHGKSELYIMKHIKSKLRIPIEIYAKNNGERSIEILSIMDILNSATFKDQKSLLNNFSKINTIKKDLINFKLFIIVDVDHNSDEDVTRYVDKTLFGNHWLVPYIHPILNNNNLEEVLNSLGYTAAITDKQKKEYKNIFPVERGKQDKDAVIELQESFRNTKKSNFIDVLDYCMENCPEFK